MNRQIEANRNETDTFAEEAGALLSTTGHTANGKIQAARQRLATALQQGKQVCCRVREKVVAGAKATDGAVRKHPYPALGIAVGVGALVGYLVRLRRSRNRD